MKKRMIILTTILMITITGCGGKQPDIILTDTMTASVSGIVSIFDTKDIEDIADSELPVSEILNTDTEEDTKTEPIVISEKNAAEEKAKKEEEERKAKEKEEADRKAKEEADRKAKEEADKKAAEEASKQENNNTSNPGNNNTSNGGNSNTGNNQPSTGRADTVNTNGIQVYISPSVSDGDYNTVISWVSNMPGFLTSHISSVNVIDDMRSHTLTGEDASGATKGGHNIYLKADGVSGRLGSLYHEAGHCLDFYGGYSNTSVWEGIRASEWSGEGYYSASNESFAEAISRYFTGGLGKEQTQKAIDSLINTGSLGSGDGFNSVSTTLYAKYKAIWIYDGPNDFYATQIGTVQIGSSIEATGLNADNTWYKVNYNGQVGYTRADMVSLEP